MLLGCVNVRSIVALPADKKLVAGWEAREGAFAGEARHINTLFTHGNQRFHRRASNPLRIAHFSGYVFCGPLAGFSSPLGPLAAGAF